MAIVVGILSDSHGQRARVRVALRHLIERGATVFVHLGDFGDGVLDELAGHNVRVVFGNCDDERSLASYARSLDIEVLHPGGVFEVEGKRIGITHGHLVEELERLYRLRVDYLLHGHTHQRSDVVSEGVRIINPGALHRACPCSAGILIPASGALEVVCID